MGGGGYWKNKLLTFVKNNRMDFPKAKITAMVECEVTTNGETLHFKVPINLNKELKKNALELLYAEVYDGLISYFNENFEKPSKVLGILKEKVKQRGNPKEKPPRQSKHDEGVPTTREVKTARIQETNIGFKILQKMGWVKGEGINGGMSDPIPLIIRKKNAGIGS